MDVNNNIKGDDNDGLKAMMKCGVSITAANFCSKLYTCNMHYTTEN